MQIIKASTSRREGVSLSVTLVLLTALSGCSMSIPGLIDRTPTGAIKSPSYPFASEDWSKAEPALLAVIRADAADDPAQWSNEDSGHKGSVAAVGARFNKGGAACRAFVARIAEDGEVRAVQGDACEKAGAVTISGGAPFRGV
ncbi:MAG: hypothetical protein KGM15_13625 [Pseudomonadota bacterium]|nr:hypothetical protein [Pseudomonadota bacterium]